MMTDSRTRTARIDAFLLYNEQEPIIPLIADALRAAGRTIHFWRTDVAIGEAWEALEEERMAVAGAVVVFLGAAGWGPSQERIARRAVDAGRRIIPVLLAKSPDEDDLDRADGIFRKLRYLHLDPQAWREGLDALLEQLPIVRIESDLVARLLEGDDDDRQRALDAAAATGDGIPTEVVETLIYHLDGELTPVQGGSSAAVSARSWLMSALIRFAPGRPEVRRLAREHIDVGLEPASVVRFWTLASLAEWSPRLARDLSASAGQDPSAPVALLAQLVAAGSADLRRTRLGEELRSPLPEPGLHCFRVLPDPVLAGTVATLLPQRDLARLVINALTHRLPSDVATEALISSLSIAEITDAIVLAAAMDGATDFWRRCAVLLAALPREATEVALASAQARNPALAPLIADLRRLAGSVSENAPGGLRIPGFQSDTIDASADYLDIRRDVEALTAVMLAKDLSPPLAIGLFGEWGSGKSFFMQAMRRATRWFRDLDGDRFCTAVVEIEFNAWHYADGALWPNLVSQILDKLSAHVSPEASPEARQAALLSDLESARAETRGLEQEKAQAVRAVEDQEGRLKTLQFEREKAEVRLSQLRAEDFRRLFSEDAALKSAVDKALIELGAPTALTEIAELDSAVREANSVGGRILGLVSALIRGRDLWLTLGLVALVIGLPSLLTALAALFEAEFAPLLTRGAAMLTLLAGGVGLVRRGLGAVATRLDALGTVKARVDALLAERRQTPRPEEREAQARLATLKGQEEGLAVRLRAAEDRVADLEQRLTELRDNRSLKRFLLDRASSDDYRKHLGMMAVIRKDFEVLTERLRLPVETGAAPTVERIILYIDDLDRCPAHKVVEVLEAVHMLLAFPLFVVVVGVDPRWLAHALTSHHGALTEPAALGGRRATPQDFLEKIFQIPLALRPMTNAGFGRLMENLLGGGAADTAAQRAEPDPPEAAPFQPRPAATVEHVLPKSLLGEDVANLVNISAEDNAAFAPPSSPPIALDVTLLELTEAERAFAGGLHVFLSTPRAAKRFSNTYRLLKAQVEARERQSFEQEEGGQGGFRVPMVLLGLVISHRPEAKAILDLVEQLIAGEGDVRRTWSSRLDSTGAPPAMTLAVRRLLEGQAIEAGLAPFERWLPKVARYSFDGRR